MASPSYPATPTSDYKTSTGIMSSVPNTSSTPSLSYYPSTAGIIAATRPAISTAMATGTGIAGTTPATPATPSPATASVSGASAAGSNKRGRKPKGPSGLSQSQQQHAMSMSPAPQTPTIGSYVSPSGATTGGGSGGGGTTTQWAEPVMPDIFSSSSTGTGQARGQSVQPSGSVSRSAGTPAPGASAAAAAAGTTTAITIAAGGSGGGTLVTGIGGGGGGQTTMVLKEEEEQGEDDLLPAMADDDYSAQLTFQAQSKDDLKVLMENLSPAQYDRFEAYRRHALPKAAVRKVIQQSLGQSVSQPVAQIVAGFAKVFVGEIVEKARADQARRGQHGPLSPDNLREAYREYQEETGRVGAARPLKGKKLFVR